MNHETTTSTGPRSRRLLGGLLVAGLLGATALTGITGATLPLHAQSETLLNHAPAEGFADLVDKVMPSVISVEVKFANVADSGGGDDDGQGARPNLPNFGDLPEDSPFRQFFQQFPDLRKDPRFRAPRQYGMGEGSGFIVSADGYAVTNNHVVKDADEVSVKTSDGREFKADVVGTDAKTDLALLKIKDGGNNFNFVKFASKEARVGDWVVAVGNPFGLGGTVTTGIVSARGRDIGSGPYDDFLQIDAPINRGNSGGPAFNLQGEVVGVNTAIYSPSGGSVGIGFAIPSTIAHEVMENLRDNGKVTRGWLGVQIQPVTAEIAENLGLNAQSGALVADVTESSPAAKAGIKTGDTVLKVDGKDIAAPRDLARRIAMLAPGKPVELDIVRDGKPVTLKVEIGTMPADIDVASAEPAPKAEEQKSNLAGLGLGVQKDENGDIVISSVEPGSGAEESGLKAGDRILKVNGNDIASVDDVSRSLGMAQKSKTVLMLVRSGDRQRFVPVQVDKPRS